MEATATHTLIDFNDRRIGERDMVALTRLPWDGPQGQVQEVENGKAYVYFQDAPSLTGWYTGKQLV